MKRKSDYYILVGDRKTWHTALSIGIWGFSEKMKGFWNTSKKDDYVAFYVTMPTKRIIGFGKFGEKFIDDRKLWPEEKLSQEVIWKYRITFRVIHTCKNWKKEGIFLPKGIIVNQGRKKINVQTYYDLISRAETKWNIDLLSKMKNLSHYKNS